jgi:hypothetical protein
MTAPAGISTLIASANIGRAGDAPARPRSGASAFEQLSIGQNLKLQVLRQLEQQRYEVQFGGRRHVVESRVPLTAGTQIEAQVEAKGDQLELRYLGAGQGFELPQPRYADAGDAPSPDSASMPDWLAALAQQYRVPLDAAAAATIARAAGKAADPALMTRGGLFLQKLAQQVTPEALEALYHALRAADDKLPMALTQSPVELDPAADNDEVAATLADALDAATPQSGAGIAPLDAETDTHGGNQDDAQRALRLLNLQDEGSVSWRYGTLPLLVGGQLIELDLVMFRERESHATRGSLKRLVMTLDTTHFGRVHVEARAVDSRLMVRLSAATHEAVDVMSAYGADVRAAIEQLGWAVDEIRYEVQPDAARAAHEVVKHVLSTGSVDQEL